MFETIDIVMRHDDRVLHFIFYYIAGGKNVVYFIASYYKVI